MADYHVPNEPPIYFHTPTPQAKNTFLYPLCLGHFFCDRTYQVSRHSYDSYLLMYIKRGAGYAVVNRHTFSFSAGQLVLLNCYQPHTYGASTDLEFYWLHFDGNSASAYYQFLSGNAQCVFDLDVRKEKQAEIIFTHLFDGFTGQVLLKEIQMGKYITDLLTLSALDHTDKVPDDLSIRNTNATALSCEKAQAFMRQHFMESLSIADIAAQSSLSPYYFIRQFKTHFGITPHQYLLGLRLDSARFYLRTSHKSIKEIAFTCGFQSENHFCIAFKKHMGITPTNYRDLQ